KELRVKNVTFRVSGVLAPKGASMMGFDQDDLLLAPWTTIKYRVSGSSAQISNASAASSSDTSQQVNTLNNLYPTNNMALYPAQSAIQAADTPMPVRFSKIDEIQVSAMSAETVPTAIKQVTDVLRERHRLRPDEPDDFNTRSMTE